MTRPVKDETALLDGVVTPADAGAVLWAYGFFGYGTRPKSFTLSLIHTTQQAALDDRKLLSLGYPGLVRAVYMMENDTDALERLTSLFDQT